MDIQSIFSNGVAHLKGSKYEKLAKRLGLSNQNFQKVLSELLKQATLFLEKLISHIS